MYVGLGSFLMSQADLKANVAGEKILKREANPRIALVAWEDHLLVDQEGGRPCNEGHIQHTY